MAGIATQLLTSFKSLGWSAALAVGVAAADMTSTWAHQTLISGSVGGTHHIEPNDTPKAGEPSQTWFALTQAGGTSIGLSDCDCELQLLGANGEVLAEPVLGAIAVEGLTDVPAAAVTFPRVGTYTLALSGSPRGGAAFTPFRLDFPVTVAVGTSSAASRDVAASTQQMEDAPSGEAPSATNTEAANTNTAAADSGPASSPEFTTGQNLTAAQWLGVLAGGAAVATAAIARRKLMRKKTD